MCDHEHELNHLVHASVLMASAAKQSCTAALPTEKCYVTNVAAVN